MPDKTYELSRRKALLGLGTIGVAGAAAGMGTSALFTDTETFEENEIQAGTTNLKVTASIPVDNIGGQGSIELVDSTADGDPAVGIDVNDIKPGDSFVVCTTVEVDDNPMYVGAQVENADDEEGANPEPEPSPGVDDDSDPIGDGTGDDAGDLDNKMDVEFGADSDPSNDSWDGSITNVEFSGSATEYLQFSQIYRGATGHGGGGDPATKIGDGSNADTNTVTHYTYFELPIDVGNQVMGDSFSWDVVWYAEQVRNNNPPTAVSDLSDDSPN